MEPLRCPTCSAPVPLGNEDVATCGFCHTSVPVPEELRALRATERQHSADRDAAERLYEKLCKPPGPLLRAWVTVTGLAGGALAVVAYLIFTASAICAALAGFALAFFSHGIAGLVGIDFVERYGGFTTYAGFVLLIAVFVVFPFWLSSYLETSGELRQMLRTSLAAHAPERPGFPTTCRVCGAALDVSENAYGVRCEYCQADNLIAVPLEVVAQASNEQKTFHHSIVEADAAARAARSAARMGVPFGGGVALVVALVFGLVGKACVAIDVDDDVPTFSESMGPPRMLFVDLAPDHPIPIDTVVHSALGKYTVALRRGEVLELVSRDDGWCTRTHIHNSTTFPLLIRDWSVTWSPQLDGTNAARFVAPYTGLFRLEIRGIEFHGFPHSDSHLEWRVGAHSKSGAPAAPQMTVEDAPPEAPPSLRANPSGRPDLIMAVKPSDPTKVELSSIAGEPIDTFDEKSDVIALAASNDGHLLMIATSGWLSVFSIPDDLEHFDEKVGWYGSQCDLEPTALGFLNPDAFAVGDATGAIVVRSVQTGLVLYELPRGPGAVTALSMSADGLTLTATYGQSAKKLTVARPELWSDNKIAHL